MTEKLSSRYPRPDPLAACSAQIIVTLQIGVPKELRESNGKMFFFLFHNSGRMMGERKRFIWLQ
jgi:hypothetical protein